MTLNLIFVFYDRDTEEKYFWQIYGLTGGRISAQTGTDQQFDKLIDMI